MRISELSVRFLYTLRATDFKLWTDRAAAASGSGKHQQQGQCHHHHWNTLWHSPDASKSTPSPFPSVIIYNRINLTLPLPLDLFKPLGPVYTKHQWQRCNNSGMMLAILLLLKSVESLEKWVATPFWSDSIVLNENRFASIIAELSQHWHWCLV